MEMTIGRHADGLEHQMVRLAFTRTKRVQDSIINSHWEIEEFCEPGLSDAIYFGSDPNVENHICGIEFLSADEMDNSDWKCTMEECKTVAFGGCSANNGNGNYVEATMNVKVNPAK